MTTLQKTNVVSVVIGIVVTAALIYVLSPILTPFLIAIFLAYLGHPLVDALERWHIPRVFGALIIFIAMVFTILLLLGFLLPLLEHQISRIIASIPDGLRWIEQVALPWLNQYFGFKLPDNQSFSTILNQHWQQATNVANIAWKTVTQSSITLIGWMANLLLIPIVTFYLLSDWNVLITNIRSLLPRHLEAYVCQLFHEFDTVLSAFFRGQLLLMLTLGIFYTLGLWIIGINLALTIGIVAGFFTIVPYLGFIIGILSATLATYIQFQTWTPVSYIILLFLLASMLENFILTPWLVGDRIGLHPVVVLFAVFCGGQLFGFLGVLLALPVAAIIMVLLRHLRTEYVNSNFYMS